MTWFQLKPAGSTSFPNTFPSPWCVPLTQFKCYPEPSELDFLWMLLGSYCSSEPYGSGPGPVDSEPDSEREGFGVGEAGPVLPHSPPLNLPAAPRPPHLLPPNIAEDHLRKEWEEENCFQWSPSEEYQRISGPEGPYLLFLRCTENRSLGKLSHLLLVTQCGQS